MAGAVDKIQLRLKAVAARWQRDGNREVARSGEQVRRELFTDTLLRPAPLGTATIC